MVKADGVILFIEKLFGVNLADEFVVLCLVEFYLID